MNERTDLHMSDENTLTHTLIIIIMKTTLFIREKEEGNEVT